MISGGDKALWNALNDDWSSPVGKLNANTPSTKANTKHSLRVVHP